MWKRGKQQGAGRQAGPEDEQHARGKINQLKKNM